MNDFSDMYDDLLRHEIATEDEIRLVCAINGSSVDSLNSILYVKTGYRTWEQYEDISEQDEYAKGGGYNGFEGGE